MSRIDPALLDKIPSLYAELKNYRLVADALGIGRWNVERHARKLGIKSRVGGHPRGPDHPEWRSGRVVDRDGYVLISCDRSHPHVRYIAPKRRTGRILEHRIFAEIKIGRYLKPGEVVDHIDGCRFHNDLDNLRVYSSNGDHLRDTLTGQAPNWSKEGKAKLPISRWYPDRAAVEFPQRIDTHDRNKKSGVVRLQQIHLGRELLGTQSLWFLGMRSHFEKAGIDWPFDQKTERDLCQKYLQMILAHPAIEQWYRG